MESYQEVAVYFEIPKKVAGKKLRRTKHQMKKLCEFHRIVEWPYRNFEVRKNRLQRAIDVRNSLEDEKIIKIYDRIIKNFKLELLEYKLSLRMKMEENEEWKEYKAACVLSGIST